MAYFTWDETLDVGVEALNDDHRHLVSYINELHSAIVSGIGISKMTHILDVLVDYTRKHFAREESLMKKHGYPKYDEHIGQHLSLVDRVTDFHSRLQKGKVSFSLELMSFLKDWLMNHIKVTDMAYRDFFAGKGVK